MSENDVSSPKPKKLYSCQLCTRRKVKCDKQIPCSYCIKCRETCVQPNLAAPRPRKKRFAEAELLSRLRRYELALKDYGADINSLDREAALDKSQNVMIKQSSSRGSPVAVSLPDLIARNPDVKWPAAEDELRQEQEMLRGSDDENDDAPITSTWDATYQDDGTSLLFGQGPTNVDHLSLHPEPVHVFSLWQAFIENVNPVMKIIHVPTLQQQILKAASDLKSATNAMHALMFGIYSLAIISQPDDECERIYGQSKAALLARFHLGSQVALMHSQVLRSNDIVVLQALVLHLNSIRVHVDPRTLFCFSGIAERIARRISLHRAGRIRGITIFDAEMRKRLWWQVILLETRMAELSGAGTTMLSYLWDANLPLNINDSDLDPGMKVEPLEHPGATEMLFCLPRYEVAEFKRQIRQANGLAAGLNEFSNPKIAVPDIARAIDELEQRIEDRYLRYCDIQIPMHHMAKGAARFAINIMRYHLYGAGYILGNGAPLDEKNKDYLFELCIEMLESHNELKTNRKLDGLQWFLNYNVPFVPMVHVLFNLRTRCTGRAADRAWVAVTDIMNMFVDKQVMKAYHGPKQIGSSPLHIATMNLMVKGWEAREQALRVSHGPVVVPDVIEKIRAKLSAHRESKTATPQDSGQNPSMAPMGMPNGINENNPFSMLFEQSMPTANMDNSMFLPGMPDQFGLDNSGPSWEFWNSVLPGSNIASQATNYGSGHDMGGYHGGFGR